MGLRPVSTRQFLRDRVESADSNAASVSSSADLIIVSYQWQSVLNMFDNLGYGASQ